MFDACIMLLVLVELQLRSQRAQRASKRRHHAAQSMFWLLIVKGSLEYCIVLCSADHF